MRYSALALAWNAVTGHKHWPAAWREPAPRAGYDVVIIGGGGHGLATAYYLAKNHGLSSIAVLEKSWIGSGNAGRNTTIIRSNYLLDGNIPFYEWSMKLWEGLERELNYNTMVSHPRMLVCRIGVPCFAPSGAVFCS
jgi:methylglutamate dehydrogenase subunit A